MSTSGSIDLGGDSAPQTQNKEGKKAKSSKSSQEPLMSSSSAPSELSLLKKNQNLVQLMP